jgi:hypothetical protein
VNTHSKAKLAAILFLSAATIS